MPWPAPKQLLKTGLGRSSMKPGCQLSSSTAAYDPRVPPLAAREHVPCGVPQVTALMASTIGRGARNERPHCCLIQDPAIGKFCGHEPFQMLPSNSPAALMKALSEVKRFWPSLSVLRSWLSMIHSICDPSIPSNDQMIRESGNARPPQVEQDSLVHGLHGHALFGVEPPQVSARGAGGDGRGVADSPPWEVSRCWTSQLGEHTFCPRRAVVIIRVTRPCAGLR
jgi:hypothetical protein